MLQVHAWGRLFYVGYVIRRSLYAKKWKFWVVAPSTEKNVLCRPLLGSLPFVDFVVLKPPLVKWLFMFLMFIACFVHFLLSQLKHKKSSSSSFVLERFRNTNEKPLQCRSSSWFQKKAPNFQRRRRLLNAAAFLPQKQQPPVQPSRMGPEKTINRCVRCARARLTHTPPPAPNRYISHTRWRAPTCGNANSRCLLFLGDSSRQQTEKPTENKLLWWLTYRHLVVGDVTT